MTAEMTRHSNQTVGGRTELDLVQYEIGYPEVQAAQSKVTEAACRVGEAMDEMAKIKSLTEANLESADR